MHCGECSYGPNCDDSPCKESLNEATRLFRLAHMLGMTIVVKEMIIFRIHSEQLNFSGNA